MKKQRIFAFDFIRAIAAVSIVLLHYNAVFLFIPEPIPDLMIFGTQIANIYLGSWAVSLFFILSGASLMYVYGDGKLKIWKFYKKRILGIYPMFWIAYFFGFLLLFALCGRIPFNNIPPTRFIFTIFGLDGMLLTVLPNYYILGEWFLGCIILLYVVFPIFRYIIKKIPRVSVIIILVIFALMEIFYNGDLNKDVIFLTRLPEFCFGMYLVQYVKKVNLSTAIVSLAIICTNWIIKPDFIAGDVQVLYIGIASFLVLMYLDKFVEKSNLLKDLSMFFSKYSYAIFLTHHVIITQVTSWINVFNMSWYGSCAAFLLCFTLTLISSYLLYKLEKKITSRINFYIDNISNKIKPIK